MTAVARPPRELARDALSRYQYRLSRRELIRIAESSRPVIAGPWHCEVGFEVLYWIPMLRWMADHLGLERERLVAVSRGGADPWYADIADRYVDLLDLISVDDLRMLRERRITELGCQKQLRELAEDRAIVETVSTELGLVEPVVLHPAAMFRLFRWFWSGVRPETVVSDHTVHAPMWPDSSTEQRHVELPERYVAVKPYFSSCFPETAENVVFVEELVGELGRSHDVVVLDTHYGFDEHRHFSGHEVVSAAGLMAARDNLAAQTRIIAGADALVCTYGGFAYLGPYLGVPTTSFFAEENFNVAHVEAIKNAQTELAARGGGAPLVISRTTELPGRLPSLSDAQVVVR